MDIIIFFALFFVPPAALICFFINLVRYIAARKNQENAKKRMFIIPLAVILVLHLVEAIYGLLTGYSFFSIAENALIFMKFMLVLMIPYSLITYFALSLWAFIKKSKAKSRKTIHIVNLVISSGMIAAATVLLIVFGGDMFHM